MFFDSKEVKFVHWTASSCEDSRISAITKSPNGNMGIDIHLIFLGWKHKTDPIDRKKIEVEKINMLLWIFIDYFQTPIFTIIFGGQWNPHQYWNSLGKKEFLSKPAGLVGVSSHGNNSIKIWDIVLFLWRFIESWMLLIWSDMVATHRVEAYG